jgi:pyruvate dehydrogenase E1 component beta subunit
MSERQITYLNALHEAIAEEMRRDHRIFFMGEGIRKREYGATLISEFGDRIISTPISEPGITGAGLGAALTGMRPLISIGFVDLMGLVMDQLLNQIGKARYMLGGRAKVPLVMLIPYGAVGMAAAQHSQSLEGWFIHVPGIRVVIPSTPYDVKGLMKTVLREDNPSLFLIHKSLRATKGPVPNEQYCIPLGQADVKRGGKDVTLVSWGRMVSKSLEAANRLEKENISIEVVDVRTLAPFDKKTVLQSVKKTGRLLIVEEECKTGGAAAEVAAIVAEEYGCLDAPIRRVAAKDVPIPYSPVLERFVLPQVEDIIEAARAVVT